MYQQCDYKIEIKMSRSGWKSSCERLNKTENFQSITARLNIKESKIKHCIAFFYFLQEGFYNIFSQLRLMITPSTFHFD